MSKRLLIISHNIIDESNNVGKTIISLLKKWPSNDVYSVYFRNEIRQSMLCKTAYMITDKDVLNSLCSKNKSCGKVVSPAEGVDSTDADRTAYRIGNKRYPIISLIRDSLWHLKRWENKNFEKWLRTVNPDLILFIPNDYILAFEVAEYVKHLTNVPMVTFFTDDAFYYGQKIVGFDKYRRKKIREIGKRIVNNSIHLFTASELMREEYKKVFGKESTVIGNCVEISEKICLYDWNAKEQVVFSYIGNLHSNRWMSLLDFGRVLDIINQEKKTHLVLNVYTASDLSNDILNQMDKIPTINMNGSISPDRVKSVQESSDALIHIEAFDEKSKKSTRLSMSTKIFEYMARGIPIFAYGPTDIASIVFLNTNGFAITCSEKRDLYDKLTLFVFNRKNREITANRAYQYAKMNFEAENISSKVFEILNRYS